MGYFKDVLKGVSWMGTLRISTRAIAFVKIAVLARLLTPDQFGIFGIASLAMALLEILTETGINVFFIQGEGKIKDYIDTSWVVSIVRGIIITVILLLASRYIAYFLNSPESYGLLKLISIVPLLRGFINPAIVKYQKNLEFNKEFIFKFVIFTFDATIAIILALITKSVISLVWGLIAGAIAEVILSLALVRPRPKFAFNLEKIKKIIERGKWVTIYGVFNYSFENGDDIVVGKIMNTSSLGLYQVAYKISSLPITEIADVIGKVTFPVFVDISGDITRLKKAFNKTILFVSIVATVIGLVLFVFPREVVMLILGEQWLAAVPALRVLSILGIIRAILTVPNAVFLAFKKQEYVTTTTFVSLLILAITVVPLVSKYGIWGAAVSATIGAAVSIPFSVYFTYKVFKRK